jgi:hypothetical protein
MSTNKYTIEDLPVGSLEVDRRVQRTGLEQHKLEKMVKYWNEDAKGVITVSRRRDRSQIIIDGQHRTEAVRRLTDNQGTVTCHVYEGLSLMEEAQMFLDLNNTTKPPIQDKFRVRVTGEDPAAVRINDIANAYGWTITRAAGDGNINAVATLERLYLLSEKLELEPNLVQVALLVITRAWGMERYGVGATIMEGLGRVLAEHRDKIDIENLIVKLKERKGGPSTLHAEATQMASLRHGKVSMAVAELVVDTYNKGKRTGDGGKALPRWIRRA